MEAYTPSDAEKKAVADFTTDFENAVVGLQMNNPEVPTISPHQYSIMLGAALYASSKLATTGGVLPPEDAQLGLGDFLNGAAVHYAQTIVDVAVGRAREVLEQTDPSDVLPG